MFLKHCHFLRKYIDMDNTKYKERYNTIRNKIKIAKKVWVTKTCKEIGEMEQKNTKVSHYRKK